MNENGLTMDEVRAIKRRYSASQRAKTLANAVFQREQTRLNGGSICTKHRKSPPRFGVFADRAYVGCRGSCKTGVQHFSV